MIADMTRLIRAAIWAMVISVLGAAFYGCGTDRGPSFPPGDRSDFGEESPMNTDFGVPDFQPTQAGDWLVETVDEGGNIGWQTSVAAKFTPSPEVQISYYDQVAKDLKLATTPFGSWTTVTLDAEVDSGKYNSLALDDNGERWISYYRASQTLRVWTTGTTVPDPTRDFGAFSDVVAVGGEVHVSYTGVLPITNLNRRAQLRHAFWDGATWGWEVIEDVDARFGSFSFTSIAYNPAQSSYHISYRSPGGQLKHAFGTTGEWTIEEVLPSNPLTQRISQTSIITTPDGEVHIFYSRVGTGGGLFHAWKDGGGWSVERVASGFGIMTPSAVALTPEGTFLVAAYRSDTRDLVLFRSNPWTPETIDSAGDTGKFASVYYDAAGCTHLAYVRDDLHDLKYARQCPPSPPFLTGLSATPVISSNEGAPVLVSASAVDINGDPVSFEWRQVNPSSPTGLFFDPNSANTTYRIPPFDSSEMSFSLEVRACDPGNLCSTGQVTVDGFGIFEGPAFGSSETEGIVKCVSGDTLGPSSAENYEDGTAPAALPLLTPDPSLFAALKSLANLRSQPIAVAADKAAIFSPANGGVPPLITDFQGISFTGLRPPDPHIAAGPNHLVATVNSNWAIFSKTGTRLFEVSAFSWFSPVNSVNFVFDPKVIYDVYNERWIVLYHVLGSDYAKWLISASQTSDPTGCWYIYGLDNRLNGSTLSSPSNWADYSDISTDGTYVYLSGNQFGFSDWDFHYTKVRVLRTSELYSGAVLNWADYWNKYQTNGEKAFTLRPAYNFGSPPPYQYFVNSHWPEDDQITLWGFKDPMSANPEVLWVPVPVRYYSFPPDARQPLPNCFIDTIDTRVMGVSWRNGSLWAVQNEGVNWETREASALRLYHIDTNAWTLLDDITFGEDNVDFFDGAVMEDPDGNVAVVVARSSDTIYPGAYYSVKPAGGSLILPVGTLKAGASHYNPSGGSCTPTGRGERWGDYAGNWIDPTDNRTFWIFHEFAATPGTWNTWVGALQVP